MQKENRFIYLNGKNWPNWWWVSETHNDTSWKNWAKKNKWTAEWFNLSWNTPERDRRIVLAKLDTKKKLKMWFKNPLDAITAVNKPLQHKNVPITETQWRLKIEVKWMKPVEFSDISTIPWLEFENSSKYLNSEIAENFKKLITEYHKTPWRKPIVLTWTTRSFDEQNKLFKEFRNWKRKQPTNEAWNTSHHLWMAFEIKKPNPELKRLAKKFWFWNRNSDPNYFYPIWFRRNKNNAKKVAKMLDNWDEWLNTYNIARDSLNLKATDNLTAKKKAQILKISGQLDKMIDIIKKPKKLNQKKKSIKTVQESTTIFESIGSFFQPILNFLDFWTKAQDKRDTFNNPLRLSEFQKKPLKTSYNPEIPLKISNILNKQERSEPPKIGPQNIENIIETVADKILNKRGLLRIIFGKKLDFIDYVNIWGIPWLEISNNAINCRPFLNSKIVKEFIKLTSKYHLQTGKSIKLREATRTFQDHQALSRRNYTFPSATLWYSSHHLWLSFDIEKPIDRKFVKLAKEFWFYNDISGDPIHFYHKKELNKADTKKIDRITVAKILDKNKQLLPAV